MIAKCEDPRLRKAVVDARLGHLAPQSALRPSANASRAGARTASWWPALPAETPPPHFCHPQLRQALRPELWTCVRGSNTVTTGCINLKTDSF